MTPEQINAAIHTQIMGHPEYEVCEGIVKLTGNCEHDWLRIATWSCTICGASGEYTAMTAQNMFAHQRKTPDYFGDLVQALHVVEYIVEHWSYAERRKFSLLCFGAESREMLRPESIVTLVDLVGMAMNPEQICYAAVQTLHWMNEGEPCEQEGVQAC